MSNNTPPSTLLEAIQRCPDIYVLAQNLSSLEGSRWGAIPDRVDLNDRPSNQLTLNIIPSESLRVEEAYREAVRHAYPYIRLFGAQCHRSVTMAVPDQSATTAYEVLNSLIEQVSWLFGCNNALNPRTKLEMMKIVGRLRLHIRPEPYPLVYIVNIDRALDDADTHGFIQALRDQVILQHAGQLVFYTGSDISARVDFPPPTPWRPEGEEVHSS
ncbi:hypothetical protein F5X98DRAFT_391354 [Xylaria grammica]|nr:hypothetical protein F5X98DRAFT_391354 [Xylaria grammica]